MGAESLKIKKLTLLLFTSVALNGCADVTALLGPAITIGNTGNIYQASLSYASSQIVQNTTGKTTFKHVADFLDPKDEFEGDLNLILKDRIKDVKKDLEKVIDKKKKKNYYSKKKKSLNLF